MTGEAGFSASWWGLGAGAILDFRFWILDYGATLPNMPPKTTWVQLLLVRATQSATHHRQSAIGKSRGPQNRRSALSC